MCGRVTLTLDKQMILDILADVFEVANTPALSHVPNYNIGPSQQLLSVIQRENPIKGSQRRAGNLTWGFIPSWTKEEDINYSLINSRSETVHEKPAFKSSFESKRCIIMADSFYEWKKGKIKRPYRFQLTDQTLFPMAGIYNTYTKKDGSKLYTCSILTCGPNSVMSPIHQRMPVILRPDTSAIWLNKEAEQKELMKLLKPYPSHLTKAYEVSDYVNSLKHNSIRCIEKANEQQSLY